MKIRILSDLFKQVKKVWQPQTIIVTDTQSEKLENELATLTRLALSLFEEYKRLAKSEEAERKVEAVKHALRELTVSIVSLTSQIR